MSLSMFTAVVARDLRLAARRRIDALLPLAFFTIGVSLFPFGIGPETQTLRMVAPGVIWVNALLAAMLSVSQLFAGDQADGSLDQMLASGHSPVALATAKAVAHWLLTGAPLVLATPVFALLFDVDGASTLMLVITLLMGTPVMSLLGALGAALTLGLRSAGVLLIIIILPLCIPVIIFGVGAVQAAEAGMGADGHLSLLGALLIATVVGAPVATAAALRIATE